MCGVGRLFIHCVYGSVLWCVAAGVGVAQTKSRPVDLSLQTLHSLSQAQPHFHFHHSLPHSRSLSRSGTRTAHSEGRGGGEDDAGSGSGSDSKGSRGSPQPRAGQESVHALSSSASAQAPGDVLSQRHVNSRAPPGVQALTFAAKMGNLEQVLQIVTQHRLQMAAEDASAAAPAEPADSGEAAHASDSEEDAAESEVSENDALSEAQRKAKAERKQRLQQLLAAPGTTGEGEGVESRAHRKQRLAKIYGQIFRARSASGAVSEEAVARQVAIDAQNRTNIPIPSLIEVVNAEDELGNTALFHAAFEGHTEIARVLIDSGARVNHRNMLYARIRIPLSSCASTAAV